jgi:hypothetical protein
MNLLQDLLRGLFIIIRIGFDRATHALSKNSTPVRDRLKVNGEDGPALGNFADVAHIEEADALFQDKTVEHGCREKGEKGLGGAAGQISLSPSRLLQLLQENLL